MGDEPIEHWMRWTFGCPDSCHLLDYFSHVSLNALYGFLLGFLFLKIFLNTVLRLNFEFHQIEINL